MAEILFFVLIGSLTLISVFQFIYVWNFWNFLAREPVASSVAQSELSGKLMNEDGDPFVTVFLCLRGSDPTLEYCIDGLLGQEYSNFEVLCILDHESDPARLVLEKRVKNDPRFKTICIANPPVDRSLKCNSLVTASKNLREECSIVAMVDADVDVDSRWLCDLVQPFRDIEIGLVSGNRWFLASDRSTGSLVRMIWNAAALPQMLAYKIPWGGSMAFRVQAAREAKVFERWEKTLFDDVLVGPAIEGAGYKIVQLPNLFMGNDESCTIGGAFRWMTRQLMDTRYYHWSWSVVAAHGINTFVSLVLSVVTVIWLAVEQQWLWALCALVAVAAFWIQNAILLRAMESRVVKKVEARKASQEKRLGWLKLGWLMVFVQLVHFCATVKAGLTTQMDWRHIRYKIKNSDNVTMTNYRPMADVTTETPRVPNSI